MIWPFIFVCLLFVSSLNCLCLFLPVCLSVFCMQLHLIRCIHYHYSLSSSASQMTSSKKLMGRWIWHFLVKIFRCDVPHFKGKFIERVQWNNNIRLFDLLLHFMVKLPLIIIFNKHECKSQRTRNKQYLVLYLFP